MDAESKELAESIRSGEYFERSRAWYEVVYFGPVSERSFFLIIAMMAFLVCIMGIMAVLRILPISDKPGILVRNSRLFETHMRLVPLKSSGQDVNRAMQDFFVRNYVSRREGYSDQEYALNYQFIRGQSDENAFAEYVARYGKEQPGSPAAILGDSGQRVVTIRSVEINSGVEPRVATVRFSTETKGIPNGSSANWTAVIEYYYNDLVVASVVDPATGDETTSVQDPQFKVVNYALSQAR